MSLAFQIKRLPNWIKTRTSPYVVYKNLTMAHVGWYNDRLVKIKGWVEIDQENTQHQKTGMVITIAKKVDFKTKKNLPETKRNI